MTGHILLLFTTEYCFVYAAGWCKVTLLMTVLGKGYHPLLITGLYAHLIQPITRQMLYHASMH